MMIDELHHFLYLPGMQTPKDVTLLLLLVLTCFCLCFSASYGDTLPATDSAAEAAPIEIHEHDHDEEESEQAAAGQQERKGPPTVGTFLLSNKFLAFYILAVIAVVLLFKGWISKPVRIGMMVVAFVLFGMEMIFPLHPSPMCATTKLFMFRFTHGAFFPQFLALFGLMIVFSLVARKLFCGWICPLGAIQELVHKIPGVKKFKFFNFTAFNTVRMAFLVLFVLTFFAVVDQVGALAERLGEDSSAGLWAAYSAYSVYAPVNMFELLHWQIDTWFVVMAIVLVGASLVLYRPFCYAICPIGAISWLLERITPGRVRVDHNACTDCGDCSEKSPCPTIGKIVDGKSVVPDCTLCGECIPVCPEKAISFGYKSRG
ncbi:4Fe-4S binding protein [candidate division GN15 bacterium]|nr:4Fe-4S binding protein [candidate division GN15 bacterium]